MSKVGMQKIFISPEVSVTRFKNFLIFKGFYGILKLECSIPLKIFLIRNTEFYFIPKIDYKKNKNFKSLWGTFNINFGRLTYGISNNYEIKLKLVGVGFKVFKKNKKLLLKLGFSHRIYMEFPFENVYMKKTHKRPLGFLLKSFDYDLLKNMAVFLRSFKKPEVYKGKGFSFRKENLCLKEGKKLKN